MLSTVAGNVLARALLNARGPVASAAVTVGSAAVAVEVLAWSERHKGTPLSRALKMPGTEMQRLFATREPTSEQLDVGRAALDARSARRGLRPLTKHLVLWDIDGTLADTAGLGRNAFVDAFSASSAGRCRGSRR